MHPKRYPGCLISRNRKTNSKSSRKIAEGGEGNMFLVQQAQKGDPDAFILLMEQCKTDLYKTAKAYLKREEDVADAMQDTILSAWEHIGELRKPACFKTWITRILINHCKDILRERKRCTPTDGADWEADLQTEQSDGDFLEMISCLPERYRSIFLLHYGQGFKTREIAEILDLSENTVKSRLKRGRMSLKSQLIL